ncbi:MAG TPA: HDOD domain-containing protein [Spirochaetes bacterium]|nr:HDOD domain-containing protein [Spirochaetota bacterium]
MTTTEIMRAIYKEIDQLPPVPENITHLRKLLKNPKSSISQISDLVREDVGLSANILKVANSAWNKLRSPAETIDRAITIIGLQRLSSILLTMGAKKVLKDRFTTLKTLWKHSYACAFFAQNLMKRQTKSKEKIESAYLAGLLHDIGKFVILSLSPNLLDKIDQLSDAKGVSIISLEKEVLGLSHAEIGQKLALKWKFPAFLVTAIGLHHNPTQAPQVEEDIPMIYTTYLANVLCELKEPATECIKVIEPKVLEYFRIVEEEDFNDLLVSLIDAYQISPEIQFV